MKIAILGPIAKDYVEVDDKISVNIGGIPYYIASALSALGLKNIVAYITCGVEDYNWAKSNFIKIETKCLPATKTLEAKLIYSSKNPDVRQHIIECYPNTIIPTPELITELENYDYVIFGPLFHDNIPEEFFTNLKKPALILGNFGLFTYGENGQLVRRHPENLLKILPFLKYLFLDRSEAEFVSGQGNVKDAAKFLQDHGLVNVIVTEGSKGSHVFINGRYYKIPAFAPKQLVNPTGAGDTYEAAFIRSLELFSDPNEQGQFAAMVATMSLEKHGAFSESLEAVIQRLYSIKEELK
jgi:sugar/nucleoside kinase (ribokinase family)